MTRFLLKVAIFALGLQVNLWIYSDLAGHDRAAPSPTSLLPALVALSLIASLLVSGEGRRRRVGCTISVLTYLPALQLCLVYLFMGLFSNPFADWSYEHPNSELDYSGFMRYMRSFAGVWGGVLLSFLTNDGLAQFRRWSDRRKSQ